MGDIAHYYYNLITGQIVNASTVLEMMNGIPLSSGWSPGLSYGLGTMQVNLGDAVDGRNLTWTIGHGGCDYGSMSPIAGYNDRFNFSIAVGTNAVAPMSVPT
jgi:hypothetical protein